MNNFNEIPLVHGFTLPQLLETIGNQVIYINRLSLELEKLKFEIEELRKAKAG